MSRKNIKKVKDTKFFHKSPPIELNTGFVSLERFIAINEYDDKTFSKEYNCDIINRKGRDAVIIVPYSYIENQLNVLMITNFRPVVYYREKVMTNKKPEDIDENIINFLEFPAGMLEEDEMNAKDEQLGIKKCAQRELEEETGYSVPLKNINVLGHNYYSSSGIITERINIATCDITGIEPKKKPKTDGSVMEENIEHFFVQFNEAMKWCKEGIIKNAGTEIGLNRLYFSIQYEHQRKHNLILQRRLKSLLHEINSLKKNADYYNKLIREFKATVTHELRHPFTEIMGYINLLKKKNLNEDKKEEAINVISRSLKKLYETNNNLIQITIKDDEDSKYLSEFNIEEELNIMIEGYKSVYPKDIETKIEVEKNCNILIGYKERFKLIMEGIISNAFKFTKSGSININVRIPDIIEKKNLDFSPDLFNYHSMKNIMPNEIEIIVKDTGKGIKQRQLKKIFIPFYQGDSRFEREYGGIGIGLSVVKDLLDTMQGSIYIDSSEGVGTIVKLRIPFGIPSKSKI